MNEIWEIKINGKTTRRSVSSEDRDRFMQDYPQATLVTDTLPAQEKTPSSPKFIQRGFGDTIQTKQEQVTLPGTGVRYRSLVDEIFPGFDKTWFGSAIAQAAGTGESMDLFMDMAMNLNR